MSSIVLRRLSDWGGGCVFGVGELPVDDKVRGWVDTRLAWCTRYFGPASDWPTIEPTPENFPAAFTGTPAEIRDLINRACRWLRLNPEAVAVTTFDNDAEQIASRPGGYSGPAGEWSALPDGRGQVALNVSELNDPISLVAVIAHELCHQKLAAHTQDLGERTDSEGVTDLLTTHLGLGIYTANAAFRFSNGGLQWSSGTYYIPNTPRDCKRLGYLAPQTFGYALACRAVARGETDPSWARDLSTNPREYMHSSLGWLHRHSRQQRGVT